VHAAQAARVGRGPVLRARLAAVRVRRDGLRVRLLGGAPGRAGLLGGPVRGLLQRRADDRGRVHQLRRAEVGPALRRPASAAARRREINATDAAIVRVERLYPLPVSELCAELARYPEAESVTWVQEEPANMGAWPSMALKLPRVLNRPVGVISLPASSAPAGGSAKLHATTHREIVETAIPQGS